MGSRISEFTPKKIDGTPNKAQCIRDTIQQDLGGNGNFPISHIKGLVKKRFGVEVTSTDVSQTLALNRVKKAMENGIHTPVPIAVEKIAPLPAPKNNAVEQVRIARLLVQAAGSKEAAKEMIDVV